MRSPSPSPSVPLCLCGEYERASKLRACLSQEATLCGARDAGIHHRDTEALRGTEKPFFRKRPSLLIHEFTKRRMSTLAIRPMAMKNIMVEEPPYEINGRGMPVVGRMPICIETLIRMWKT